MAVTPSVFFGAGYMTAYRVAPVLGSAVALTIVRELTLARVLMGSALVPASTVPPSPIAAEVGTTPAPFDRQDGPLGGAISIVARPGVNPYDGRQLSETIGCNTKRKCMLSRMLSRRVRRTNAPVGS